jgi:PAS domain S-box-containing protein
MKKRSSTLPDTNKNQQKIEETPESSRQLEQLFDEMSSGYALHEIICDPHGKPVDYRFLEMNAAFERQTGLVAREVLGKRALEVIPNLEPFWIETYGRVALTGQPERFENYAKNFNKYFSVFAFCPKHGQVLVLFEDITERKRSEEKSISNEENFRSLFNSMTEGVAINELVTDENGDVVDYTILEVNPAFEINTPYNSRDVLGKSASEVYQFSQEFIRTWWQQHIEMGQTAYTELYHEPTKRWHAITTTRPVNQRFYTIFSDITERKLVLNSLEDANESLSLALDASNAGTYDWDIINNTFIWSSEFLKIFGMPADTIAGFEAWKKAVHPQDVEAAGARIQESIDKHTELVNNYRIVLPTGEVRHIRSTGKTYFDGDRPLRMVGLCMDVTPLVQAEQKLQESAGNMQAILDANLDAVFLVELDGTIVAANLGQAERFGRNLDELVGSNTYDLLPQEVAENRRKFMDQVITSGKPVRFEDKRSELTIENSIYPVLDEQGKVVRLAIFGRDVSERKKDEEKIRHSESELKKAQSYAHVGSWVWNIKEGYLEWSDEMYKIFGISKESFSGNLEDVVASAIHPDDRQKVEESNRSVVDKSKPIPLEYRILHPDGSQSVVWGEAGELEKDAEGNPALLRGIVMDITERKQAEEKQTQTYELLTNLARLVPGVIYQYRLYPDGSSAFPYSSPGMYSIYEVTPEQVREDATPVFGRLHPEDAGRLSDLIFESARTLDEFYCEYRVILPEQGLRWRWSQAHPERMADGGTLWHGTIQDITERKQAEEKLREERQRMAGILQGTNAGTWEWNVQTGETIFNERWAEIIGYTLDEISPISIETWMKYAHPEDLKVSGELLEKHFCGELDYYEFESRMKHKDGSWVWILDRGKVISWTEDKKPLVMMGTHQDITDRKQAEEALQESERRYRERATELETIMDIAPVALWIAQDPACHVIVGNRTANELHRILQDQNVSLTPATGKLLRPERLKILHDGVELTADKLPLQICASKGIEIRDFESQIVFEDGTEVHELGNAKPLFDESGKPRGAVGAFMNITSLKQVEEQLRHRAEELDALQKTVFDITAAQTLPGLLESIVVRACQLVGAPGGGLYLVDPVRKGVRCEISYNTPGNYVGVILKLGEGVAGRVAQTGQPFSVNDYKNWAGRAQSFELERPFSTVLGVPLLWGGQVYGVIDVLHFDESRSFSQADMDLLTIFAGHAAIAIENSRLLEASQAGETQVRILSTRLAEAEENERRRIARELHDQVGQSLSALSINMNIMHSQVPEYLPGFKRRLDDSLMLIDQTTDHIRHLMSELRPAVLDDYGLKAALDWAVGSIAKRTSLKLQVEGECNRFPPRVEIALFRIAQEALGNITRHAHARNVKVLLSQDGPKMSMTISDDGVGFNPASVEATEKSGWGLRLMAERAESISANLQVESTPGQGTCITVRYHDDNSTGG